MITLLRLVLSLVQVDEPYQRFSAAYASLDANRVSQIYVEDALMLPPGGEFVRGRAAIRSRYVDDFESDREHGHTVQITFEMVDRVAAGDLRSDYGYFTIVTRTREGRESRYRGKFSKVWVRGGDGVWRIKSDSYSSARH